MANEIPKINNITEKTTLAAADLFLIEDSADTNAKKRVQYKNFNTKTLIIKAIADGTVLTVADGLGYITIPVELNGWNIVTVGAHVYTVSSSGLPTVQIYNLTDSQDILSTRITIDDTEYDSKDATTAPVINTSYDDVATGDVLRIDCDVAGTGTKGLEVRIGFKLP